MIDSSLMQLNVCADLGASEIKVIYQMGKNPPCGLTLFPNVLEVTSGQVELYRNSQIAISENFAWLKLKVNTDKVVAVDQLAENIFALSNYRQLKINSADWRILAIVGKIINLEKDNLPFPLEKIEFNLNLTILLPFGEFNKQEIRILKNQLTKKLKKFYHNDQKRSIFLQKVKVLPEGLGSLMCSPQKKRMVIVMLGHRNTSYLYFEDSKFIEGKSIQLGFSFLVEEFCHKTSGQEDNNLTTLTLWRSRLNLNELNRISKTQRPEYKNMELKNLEKAFRDSRKALWAKIKKWLLKELAEIEFDTMQFTGGVSEFLKPLIMKDNQFEHLPLEFAGQKYSETVRKALDFPGLREERIPELSLRLVDCYGAFLCQI